jgi:diguanylate cyclase (GGDEF)-like protein
VSAVRADDVVGRQSGDEFAILLDRVRSNDEAVASAERIQRALRRPIQLGARSIVDGGSIGIALAAEHDTTAEELMTRYWFGADVLTPEWQGRRLEEVIAKAGRR